METMNINSSGVWEQRTEANRDRFICHLQSGVSVISLIVSAFFVYNTLCSKQRFPRRLLRYPAISLAMAYRSSLSYRLATFPSACRMRSGPYGDAARKVGVLRCEYCDRTTMALLLKCNSCGLRCCRKDTFWCSAKNCGYQVCRRCQRSDEFAVQRIDGKWPCSVHHATTCTICANQGFLCECSQCNLCICEECCYKCCVESCE